MSYKSEYKERVCKDCGEVFYHDFNIGYCPQCRSRRHSESRKRAFAKELDERRKEYSFKRWEDCLIDDEIISTALQYVSFLKNHFGTVTDSLTDLRERLESRMASASMNVVTEADAKCLMNSNVWQTKVQPFISNTLWEYVESIIGHELEYGNSIIRIIDDFIPSPKICAYLVAHFKNHQRCADPLNLMPLMKANLELSIIKEFNQSNKAIINEANK